MRLSDLHVRLGVGPQPPPPYPPPPEETAAYWWERVVKHIRVRGRTYDSVRDAERLLAKRYQALRLMLDFKWHPLHEQRAQAGSSGDRRVRELRSCGFTVLTERVPGRGSSGLWRSRLVKDSMFDESLGERVRAMGDAAKKGRGIVALLRDIDKARAAGDEAAGLVRRVGVLILNSRQLLPDSPSRGGVAPRRV